jgi:hypothetical protein
MTNWKKKSFWNLKWKFSFLSFENIFRHTSLGKWKKKYYVYATKKILKWKIVLKIVNESFDFWNFKKIGHTTREKWKILKWRNHIFRLCHREKLLIIPLYHLCISLYTAGASCGNTIHLNHQIMSSPFEIVTLGGTIQHKKYPNCDEGK